MGTDQMMTIVSKDRHFILSCSILLWTSVSSIGGSAGDHCWQQGAEADQRTLNAAQGLKSAWCDSMPTALSACTHPICLLMLSTDRYKFFHMLALTQVSSFSEIANAVISSSLVLMYLGGCRKYSFSYWFNAEKQIRGSTCSCQSQTRYLLKF